MHKANPYVYDIKALTKLNHMVYNQNFLGSLGPAVSA